MRKLKEFLIKVYVVLFLRNRKIKWPDKSRKEFDRSMIDFSRRINSFPYKSDPLWGLIDYTAHPDKFYDETRKEGRDCDDWARQWSIWGVLNGYKAVEWIVCNPKEMFRTMHVITILSREGKYYLMNYKSYGPFSTQEEALNYMKSFSSYEDIIAVEAVKVEA